MSESRTISTLKRFDIFALPFQFTFGNNEKEKKTTIGGLISIAILITSSVYFGYLCYLYFENKVQPQVVSSNIFQKEPYTVQFKSDFIAVEVILPSGENLYDYQKKTAVHKTGDVIFNFLPQPLIPCADQDLQGYMCLDSSKVGDGDNLFSLTYNPENLELSTYNIVFAICNSSLANNNCEKEEVIRDTVISYSTQLTIRLKLKQFNTSTKVLEERIVKEPFYFDTNLGFYTKFHLQKTDLTEQQGFIIQNSEYSSYFSGYARREIFSTQSYIKSQMKMNLLGAVEFFIGSESISLNIQFPQFTSLLAQFTSVFNSLLFLGIISKFFAESEIFSQVAEMQLKIYFKKSALFILQQIGQGENTNREQQISLDKLINYIKNADFKNLGKKMKISFLRKQLLYFNSNYNKKYKNRIMYVFLGRIDKEEKESIQVKMFKQIVSQSNKALNIFEIQKELLQMKIMLRLILSVEQYAAIQLCGSKLPINSETRKDQDQEIVEGIKQEESQISNQIVSQDQKLDKSIEMKEGKQNFQSKTPNHIISFNKEKQESVRKLTSTVYPMSVEQQILDKCNNVQQQAKLISHLEKIDLIERDESFFKECLDNFLLKKYEPQSEIDKRILECMIGQDDLN